MFSKVYFEISSVCNGKCFWCQTGRKNIDQTSSGKFVDFEEFKKTIYYLIEKEFINRNSEIALYNWGEPFLHPQFKDIIKFLNKENLKLFLSTNCSKAVLFEEDGILANLQSIILSMSGFSQKSYDNIHGFNFSRILKNIIDMKNNFINIGYKGQFLLAFHVYQFNTNEIIPAAEFARQNQISFMPSLATINDSERMIKYLKDKLDYSDLKRASQDLFLFHLKENRKNQRPKDYICPQYSKLVLDENCNVVTCCGDITPMEKIFNVKAHEVNKWRSNGKACMECKEIGMDFMASPPPIANILTFNR